jgi:hypothetical protein
MNLGIGTMGLMLVVVVGGWAWRRRENGGEDSVKEKKFSVDGL